MAHRLTDKPEEQVYYNKAGTMMDRNLGATSAIPGDVGALGLLYQWGRKDPFLGSSSIRRNKEALSTISWPLPVVSTSNTGTIEYSITHPTTYITKMTIMVIGIIWIGGPTTFVGSPPRRYTTHVPLVGEFPMETRTVYGQKP